MNAYDLSRYGDKIQNIFAEVHVKLDEKVKSDRTFTNDNYETFIVADPTDKKVYLRWILDSYINGGIKLYEDLLSRVKPALEDYDYLKQAGHLQADQKIIEAYCGIVGCTKKSKEKPGLDNLIDSYKDVLESHREKIEEREQVKEDAERVFENDEYIIIHPKTKEASCHYGKGTKWCTAATRGENMFTRYNQSGPLYIIIPKSPSYEGEKYQMHVDTQSFMDDKDIEVNVFILSKKSSLYEFQPFKQLVFLTAIEKGNVKVVKTLLTDSKIDPAYSDDFPIREASRMGHTEIVKLLLADERVNPAILLNLPIRIASRDGHLEVVKLLIADSRVNPADDDNMAIRWASKNGHVEVVKLLLTDPRVSLNSQ